MAVEVLELLARENGPGRIVGIRQINDLGVFGDGSGQLLQIVMPVVVRDSSIAHAARVSQHLKSPKGRLCGEDLVLIAQEGSNNVRYDTVGAAAGDNVPDLSPVFLGQFLAQIETA